MPPTIRRFSPITDTHLVPYLAAIHANCITSDHTIATFLPPLSHEKLLTWWKDCIAAITRDERAMFLLLDIPEVPMGVLPPSPLEPVKGAELMGVVMLGMPFSETGPFRAGVEKLLVSPRYRRRGGARLLLAALEEEARRKGRTLLITVSNIISTYIPCNVDIPPLPPRIKTLDTESGSPAQEVFRRLGWTEIGTIPNYSKSPAGGLRDGTFFYKQL